MNTSGEAADQVMKMMLNGTEVLIKLTGTGAKNAAVIGRVDESATAQKFRIVHPHDLLHDVGHHFDQALIIFIRNQTYGIAHAVLRFLRELGKAGKVIANVGGQLNLLV